MVLRTLLRHSAPFTLAPVLAFLLAQRGLPVAAEEETKSNASTNPVSQADELRLRGQTIYAESCAGCHGEKGQGVEDGYAEPLVGDLSIGELSKRVTETMPEGEPELCVAEDANAVAAYIHHAFYSEAARIRNRPPSIATTHLTSNQLRQSLADLYARFSGPMWLAPKSGIDGSYFDGARGRRRIKRIERVDATIDFDWMHDGPGQGIDAEDFSVEWRGGLKPNETGRYEIVIRSTCAFVCDLGRFGREFIDNQVQSGDKTEFRKTVVLTAGRITPIEIQLFQRERKTEQPPARISLSWIPPNGIEEIIPQRNLLATLPPAIFSLQTKLPPDDRSYGYERGLAVDRQWDDSTTAAAVEFGQVAVEELWPEYGRDGRSRRRRESNGESRPRARLRRFLADIAEIAFRGPLDEEAERFYLDEQIDQTEDDAEAIKRSLLVILKSPRFLYPELDRDRTQSRRAANRLTLTLFDSLPADRWLLALARDDELKTDQQVRAAAQRMVHDYRTRAKTREFLDEWLNLGQTIEVTKSGEEFSDFDARVVADLKASLDAFLDDVVWGEASDFRQLFLADWAYTTPKLEEFYGAEWRAEQLVQAGLVKAKVGSDRRIGLLSHPYLMSRLAYQDSTSPIHRGVFLIRYLLGRTLQPPQEAFAPLSPDLHPDLTTRQRVELQTSPESCQVCHRKINGLGFALENYDAVGRFREKEGGKPVDPTGHYMTRSGEAVGFHGASELAQFVASSDDAHRAFVNRAFLHFAKQPIAAYGPDQLDKLTEKFRNDNFHIRRLLVEIAVIASTRPTPPTDEET